MNMKSLVGIVLATWVVSFHSVVAVEEAASDRLDPLLTVGGLTTEDYSEGIGDVVLPLYFNGRGLVFINPRFSFTDRSEEEYNLGIGYRHLIRDNQAIVGANVFYDRRETALGSSFNQVGFGAEYLSHFIDARANVYLPLDRRELVNEFTTQEESVTRSRSTGTKVRWDDPYAVGHDVRQNYEVRQVTRVRATTTTTTRHFREYEVALRGWDAEIGALLPIEPIEEYVRVKPFAGYYRYESRYGVDTIDGFRGRLEMHIRPSFLIDAVYYSDDELTGGNWSVGAYVSVPFDLSALANRRNPFAGAGDRWDAIGRQEEMWYRLTDMVKRDPQIRSRLDQPEEQEELRATSTSSSTSTSTRKVDGGTVEILADVTFVDGNRGDDANPGTYEDPKMTVQGGIDGANSPVVVFPLAGGVEYVENVLLTPGVDLYGAFGVVGFDNRRLGRMPTIDGRNADLPTIHMADNTMVAGFRVWNTGGTATPDPIFLQNVRFDRVGIYGGNVTDLRLVDNILENCSQGAMFLADAVPDFNLLVDGCVFRDNFRRGLRVRAEGTGTPNDTFQAVIRNSSFLHNDGHGAFVRSHNYTDTLVEMDNVIAGFNAQNGIQVRVHGPQADHAGVHLTGMAAYWNDIGLNAIINVRQSILFEVNNSVFAGNAGGGMMSEMRNSAGVQFVAADILAADNGGPGMFLTINDSSNVDVQVDRFRAPDNGFVFMGSDLQGPVRLAADVEAGDFVMFLERVIANGAVGDGVGVNVQTREGDAIFIFEEIEASNNSGSGISIQAASTGGNIQINHESVEAVNNELDGISLMAHAGGLAIHVGSEITATDNDRHGVNIELVGREQAIFLFVRSEASRNAVDGIRFDLLSYGGAAGNNAVAIIDSSEALDNGLLDVRGTVAASGEGDAVIILVAEHDSHDLSALSEFGNAIIIVFDP